MKYLPFFLLVCSTVSASDWTPLAPSPDSRLVYVSSSIGLDTNDGLTEATPKKTLASGMALVRNGFPDWLCLMSGDTWQAESLFWTASGRSATEKTVLTSYGAGPRPVIKNGMFRYINTTIPISNLAIVGIEFYASYSDPASPDYLQGVPKSYGIQFTPGTMSDLLIEDCKVSFYATNIQIRNGSGFSNPLRITNVAIRRNVILDAKSFGLLSTWCDGILIEENCFDRNGWANRTKFLHNIYSKENRNYIARGNILSRGGNFGLKISSDHLEASTDFVVDDNTFYQAGFSLGYSDGAKDYDPLVDVGILNGSVTRNVLMSPDKVVDGLLQSFAMNHQNIQRVDFDANIFSHCELMHTGVAIGFGTPAKDISITNSIVSDWISNWFVNSGSYFKGTEDIVGLTTENNSPNDNQYLDPAKDFATYSESLGDAADAEAFLLRASQQSKANWDPRYTATAFNDYIRAGFAEVIVPDPPVDPPPVDPPTDPPVEPDPVPELSRLESALTAAAKAFLSIMEPQ